MIGVMHCCAGDDFVVMVFGLVWGDSWLLLVMIVIFYVGEEVVVVVAMLLGQLMMIVDNLLLPISDYY